MTIETILPDDKRFVEHSDTAILINAQIGYDSDDPDDDVPLRLEFKCNDSDALYSQTVWLTRKEAVDLGRELIWTDPES